MEYLIKNDQCIYNMNSDNEPVLKVPSGSQVIFETSDCFQGQIRDEKQSIDALDWERINPATGPLYIEGAEPGDVLKVEILEIEVNKHGIMAAIPDAGLLGEQVEHSLIKIIPVKDGQIIFNEQIHLPLNPMIGVIGVAPREGSIPCGTPDHHGGNMDNSRIKQGSTLYLPVMVPGALLAMGDLHALMGDGEIMVTGVEIGGKVRVLVEVIGAAVWGRISLTNPLLEDSDYLYTIASDADLLSAIKVATADMQKIIIERRGLSFNEAGMLLSAVGDVQICQVVDPKLTVRLAFPKKYL